MAFTRTSILIRLLAARLCELPLAEDQPASVTEKLFERVGFFGANKLEEAMAETFATEQRVCFIVPVGDDHQDTRDRLSLVATRTTNIVLLIADRALDAGKAEALIGGPQNVGILDMKDRVIENLFAVPFTDCPDLAFAPGKGEPLMIQKPESGNLGRECWAQAFSVYAGLSRTAIP